MGLISFTEKGFYCEKAKVYIDPWKPVRKALITHAHADHSRGGMKHYLAHPHSIPVMKHRLGEISVQPIDYAESININGVKITFYPAGHVPGSAQIKLEDKSESWVISGDYKLGYDGVSTPFESVKCSHFITESTFGLPIYNWDPQAEVMSAINKWWIQNAKEGITSIMLGYSFGKAQRILANIDSSIGEIFVHGAIHHTNNALKNAGYTFPKTEYVSNETDKSRFKGALILAPPSALGSSWLRKFKPYKTATASGWMALRGARRRRNVDKGFVLSDHADWKDLNRAVIESGAENVYATHGYSSVFAKWLNGTGLNAQVVKTAFEGELSEIGESLSSESE